MLRIRARHKGALGTLDADLSWFHPIHEVALRYESRKVSTLVREYAQFVEDATAILNCRERRTQGALGTCEAQAFSTAIMHRRDFEGQVSVDVPIADRLEILKDYADRLHTDLQLI